MNTIKNENLDAKELNQLLATVGWGSNTDEKLKRALELSWGWMTVRNDHNELIGFVQVLSDGIKHAYILRLLVHKDYQGKGIGKQIVKELLEWLEENGLNPILITKPNEEPFYNQFDFSREQNGFISLFKWKI